MWSGGASEEVTTGPSHHITPTCCGRRGDKGLHGDCTCSRCLRAASESWMFMWVFHSSFQSEQKHKAFLRFSTSSVPHVASIVSAGICDID